MTDAVFNLDRFKSKRRPLSGAPPTSNEGKTRNAPTRLPRQPDYWAPVPLVGLLDRRNDEIYSARTRLLLYLAIKSRRGQRPVRLTNEMAAEIGLDRPLKCRTLRFLEARGRVTVVQVGQHAPWVYLLQPCREPLSECNGPLSECNTGSPS